MPATQPPAEAEPVLRAALAIRAALEQHGVSLGAGALLAAAGAAATELARVGDHVHHWQAWRDQAPAYALDDDLAALERAARATVDATKAKGGALPYLEAAVEQVEAHRAGEHPDPVRGLVARWREYVAPGSESAAGQILGDLETLLAGGAR